MKGTTTMQTVIDKAVETYRAEWDAFLAIREEFASHFDRYAAFRAGEDSGSIAVPTERRPRLSILQLAEKTRLEFELTPALRDRFSNLDAYRSHRWVEEMAGR
jgi:hypothetical protein